MKKIILGLLFVICILPIISFAQSQDTSGGRKSKQSFLPPVRRNVPGLRFSLSTGELYIPDFFKADSDGKFDLAVFFHGAAWCSEQGFYDARKNAVLVSISLKSYEEAFQDTTRFQKILDEVTLTLETTNTISHPRIGKICLSSFSGGYSAVRAILKVPMYYDRVTDLVLADSLYCGTDATGKFLDDKQMAPYLRFARDAASGKKTMWFTQLYPPEEQYRDNNTTHTAAYLMEHLNGNRVSQNQTNPLGMQLLYSCDTGNFHIRGYAGMANQDHFNHFYNIGEYFGKMSFDSIE